MNRWVLGATAVSLVLTLAHLIGGEGDVHLPLLATQVDPLMTAYVSIIWHLVSAALVVMTIALAVATMRPRYDVALIFVALGLCVSFAGVFMGYGLAHLGTLIALPQWTAFVVIAGLASMGLRHRPL